MAQNTNKIQNNMKRKSLKKIFLTPCLLYKCIIIIFSTCSLTLPTSFPQWTTCLVRVLTRRCVPMREGRPNLTSGCLPHKLFSWGCTDQPNRLQYLTTYVRTEHPIPPSASCLFLLSFPNRTILLARSLQKAIYDMLALEDFPVHISTGHS